MPKPKPNESRSDFMERCVPMVMDEGKDRDQAVAMCSVMFDEKDEKASKSLVVKAEIERTDKGMLAVASTAVEDRHGEVVDQSGWDIKNYKKNPVIQWAHDHTIPAIGIAKNIRIEGVGKKARLLFEPVFHDITEEAKALKKLVEGTEDYPPILNSFSVGFRATEMDGNVYTKSELLEISLVNVPANPEARVLAVKQLQKEGFEEEVIKNVVGVEEVEELDTEKDNKVEVGSIEVVSKAELDAVIAKLDDVTSKYEEVVKGLKHLNPQGRKSDVITQRQALLKVIARANDKILEKKPDGDMAKFAKVIKRASEKLIIDHKQELKSNGKN